MKNQIVVVVACVVAAHAFAQFGQPRHIQKFKVNAKACDAFVEKLEGMMGVAIGSPLSDEDAKKYDRYKEKNGTYYVSGLKKLDFALSRYCFIEREKFNNSYITGYWIKADDHKCLENDLMSRICNMAGQTYDSDAGSDGFTVHDGERGRSINVSIERGSGSYYLVLVQCDDVGKFLANEDLSEEQGFNEAAAEKEESMKKAAASAKAKHDADESAAAELDAVKTKQFNTAVADSLAKKQTNIESVGIDFPVKSLCGFRLGSTVEESLKLVKDGRCDQPDWARVEGASLVYKGVLKKPFRKFTDVELRFCGRAGLQEIRLRGKVSRENYSKEDIQAELSNVISMLERKFSVKMRVIRDVSGIDAAEWGHEQELPAGVRKQFLDDKIDPNEDWISPRVKKCRIERIFLNNLRDSEEFSLILGSAFIMHYADLLKWRVNHKTMDGEGEGFDDL